MKFTISATAEGEKKALEFPASIKAGLVDMTLVNTDKVPRAAQIIRIEGDHTVDDVLKVVNAESAKIPDWMQDGGGLGGVEPGASATAQQVLAPGKYVIWDDEGGDEGDAPSFDELGRRASSPSPARQATSRCPTRRRRSRRPTRSRARTRSTTSSSRA